jgi:hypothetical protein
MKESILGAVMKLYKYLGAGRGIDVLRDLKIRFTQPSEYNDPFECNPVYGERELYFPNDPTLTYEAERTVFGHVVNTNFLGLSLSAINNSALMWSHYADSHKGLVIEFESESAFFDYNNSKLFKMIYSNTRPRMLTYDELKRINSNPTEIELRRVEGIVCTKCLSWSYEEEYRLLRPCEDLENLKGEQLDRAKLFTDFYKNGAIEKFNDVLVSKIPKEAITGIYFGLRTESDVIDEVRKVLKENNMGSSVDIHEAVLSSTDFSLGFPR